MDAARLNSIPLFKDLDRHEREQIARWADEVDVPAGYHLLDEGRFAHEFFVIEDGEVEVRIGDQQVTTLGPGEMLGEIALLKHDTRTASVIATSPVRAIVMAAREFDAMRSAMPAVAAKLEATMRERLG
jgi:CRP-like cAMP-binding protein